MMDDDDRPRKQTDGLDLGAATRLASESLDSYSLDELDARTALLEAEIARITLHRGKAADHMQAANALFRSKST